MFGAGLVVAGMTDPGKVLAFLDVTGRWDPSLAFVMASAIGVHAVLLRAVLRRPRPIFAAAFERPPARGVDTPLLAGAAVFGVGWGLGGVCPGPGIVDAASGSAYALVFTVTMACGAVLVKRLRSPRVVDAEVPALTRSA
jgi:uncharacterized membrane protein YedE/YeeE